MFENLRVDGTVDPIKLATAIAEVMVKNGGSAIQKGTGNPEPDGTPGAINEAFIAGTQPGGFRQ